MSGYIGNPDAEAEHALILAENGIHNAHIALLGPVLTECIDCGDKINSLQVSLFKSKNMKCVRCIDCQRLDDNKPKSRIKMLDYVL